MEPCSQEQLHGRDVGTAACSSASGRRRFWKQSAALAPVGREQALVTFRKAATEQVGNMQVAK